MLGNVTVPRSVTYRLRAFGTQAFFSAVGFLGNPALACAALKLCKDV
jgi:hypothetical protein